MDTPLYKVYLLRRLPSYYQAQPEDINALRSAMALHQRELGVRDLFNGGTAWSNERYEFFGVEFYPNLNAVQEYTRRLMELKFYQYFDTESYLGIPMDNSYPDFSFEPPCLGDCAVYRLYFSRRAPLAALIPKETREDILMRVQETAHSMGISTILSAYMRWNNESWDYFGVERFPNMETLIGYSQFLTEIDWYSQSQAASYLGYALGGLAAGMEDQANPQLP